MDKTLVIFRWDLGKGNLHRRAYAEGTLIQSGRPADPHFLLRVDLVADEMAASDEAAGVQVIDPDRRSGLRIFCTINSDQQQVRPLAYLAPLAGADAAHPLIFDAVADSPDAVAKFGDDWLTDLIAKHAARTGR